MSIRIATAAALVALCAACASHEPAHRAAALPPPAAAAPVVGASGVTFGDAPVASGGAAAAPAQPQTTTTGRPADPIRVQSTTSGNETDVTVEARQNVEVKPPDGDPRNAQERRRDAATYDRCILRAQRRHSDEPGTANPVADTPEEMCRRALGMTDRDSVPATRR